MEWGKIMKLMKALFLLIVLSLFALTGCGDSKGGDQSSKEDGGASEETYNWDFSVFVSLEHPNGASAMEFANRVKEKTDGRVNITVRPSGELPYEPSEYLTSTKDNLIQISDAFISFVSGDLVVGGMPNLPFLINDLEELETTIEVIKPYLEDEFNKFNAKLLYYYPWPQQNFWGSGESINSYKDLAGLKFRAQSPEQAVFLELIGAAPVSLSTPEVPAAMQRGVANGVLTAALNINGSKWYDFLNWGYGVNMQVPPSYIVVNKDAFNALPADLQAAVEEAAQEIQAKIPQELMDFDKVSLDILTSTHNIEFKQASDEEIQELTELSKPYWADWANKKGPTAIEALEKVKEALNK